MKKIIPIVAAITLVAGFNLHSQPAPPATPPPAALPEPANEAETVKAEGEAAASAGEPAANAFRASKEAAAAAARQMTEAKRALERVKNNLGDLNPRLEEHKARLAALDQFAGGMAGREFPDLFVDGGGSAPGRSLLISASGLEGTAASDLDEDLNVMGRILNKAVDRSAGAGQGDRFLGIEVSSAARSPRNIYLENFGALFLLNVKFPLLPTPTKTEQETEKPANSAWDEAKQEIYGPRGLRFGNESIRSEVFFKSEGNTPYDAEKVDALKRELITALKDAYHIRHMGKNDNVTVVVTGNEPAHGTAQRLRTIVRRYGGGQVEDFDTADRVVEGEKIIVDKPEPAPKPEEPAQAPDAPPKKRKSTRATAAPKPMTAELVAHKPGGASRPSTLTLQAKKGDIDAFAKGTLDYEAFRKKVSVTTY